MPVSDPDVSRPRLIRDATFLAADRREIARRRGHHNQLGFAYQIAFVRVLGRFPQQAPLEIDGEILRFAALQLGAAAETIHAYARRQQTVSEHQQRIGQYLRLGAFDTVGSERLAGQGDLTACRRAGLPVRPRPAASCQPDRVEERHPLRRDQDRPLQAQDARLLACISTRILSVPFTRRKQHSSQRPVQQGPAVTASRPNKIGASTPYNFGGKKPTPYGGLLPVVGRALI